MVSTADDKEIRWVGSSYDDLLAFPKAPRKEAGFQLDKVQAGLEPTDWKPFDEVGAGTREIRISDAKGTFRVMYVDKFAASGLRPGLRGQVLPFAPSRSFQPQTPKQRASEPRGLP